MGTLSGGQLRVLPSDGSGHLLPCLEACPPILLIPNSSAGRLFCKWNAVSARRRLMAGLKQSAERRHYPVSAVTVLVIVSVMALRVIQWLPAELTVSKSAAVAPSTASQPSLFDTLLALHPTLPAAHEAVIDAFSRLKASLRPEPPPITSAPVLYMFHEPTGDFVPVVRN